MPDLFTTRVRAAAVAGWWTVLAAIGLNLVQWLAFRHFSAARPTWVLAVIGRGSDWDHVLRLSLAVVVVFKVFIWILLMMVIWLTLWARQLKKHSPPA
jgi:hypothetical protein